MKGTYVLLSELAKDSRIRIGSLGSVVFAKGYYAYVGSGMGSLEKRIERHFLRKKKKFWHIDYFLEKAKAVMAVYRETPQREECELAGKMAGMFGSVRGFGCSDCSCSSHLFYSADRKVMEREIVRIARSLRGPRSPLRTARSPAS